MPADRTTGKSSYFLWNGVQIPITKYGRKATRKIADATDSGDYNANTDIIQPVGLPVSVSTEITAEGRYRFSVTPSLDQVTYSGAYQIPVVLGRTLTNPGGHGTFDITEYNEDGPYDDMVTWTATFVSNGPFTPNQ
jgi:hypothetical protein